MLDHEDSASELLELLEELESGLLEFEGAIARNEESRPLVHALFRVAHNLKSSFAFQGLSAASTLFHTVETCLDRLRDGRAAPDSALVDLLMEAVDAGRSSTMSQDRKMVADEALRLALMSYGEVAERETPKKTEVLLDPGVEASLDRALAPGWTAWVLEKSVGPGIDDANFRELPIFGTLADIGTIVSGEIRRTGSGEGILIVVFATGLPESELRLTVFDPLIPLDRASPPATGHERFPRILAVDDEPLVAELIRLVLSRRGRVEIASSGREGLGKFKTALASLPFDAVFLDLMLGDMSGIEVLASMRAAEEEAGIEPGRGVRVAICTSIKDYGTISDAFRSQCDLYLVKPLTEANLLDAFRKLGFGNSDAHAPRNSSPITSASASSSPAPPSRVGFHEGEDKAEDPFVVLGELEREFETAPTLETLCRLAVDKGRRFLDLDRVAIFLYESKEGRVRGTTGVDQNGTIVDESDFFMSLPDDPLFAPSHRPGATLLQVDEGRPLKFRDRKVGWGWTAAFPLRSGNDILGWAMADNLHTSRPLLPIQRWLLALFGQLLAAQLVRKRSREELVEAIAKLTSESLRKEAELGRLQKASAEQSATKERLFSIFAHDLRGPLGAVKGMLDMALDKDKPLSSDELRECLPEMRSAVASSWSLLENLLDWIRSQLNEIAELHDKVALADMAKSAALNIKPLADLKMVGIEVDVAEDHSILADRRIVEAIIRNFIANAVKFSPPGSTVLIHTARDPERQETLIAVTDRGIGMDAEQIGRLFTMDPSKKRKGTAGESGSGIGLLFCADLARHIGGRIEVVSEVGRGSSFSLIVPEIAEGDLAAV